jgi:flagellar basal-body rod modification protein FlgD
MSQAITSGITASSALSQAVQETKGDDLGKSDFLLLLVTQFQNQDPLNPMDDKEFVAQLAQFSSLEQLMNLNTSMESLTAATKEQQMMNAASYIGKEVAAAGSSIAKTADGVSTFYYAVGDTMTRGTINVYDQNMQLVYSEALGSKAAGTYTFDWSGLRYDGATAPEGVYYVRLSCEDASGGSMLVDTLVTGSVAGVTTYDGVLYLRLSDGRTVALSDVRELAAPVTASNEAQTP